MNAVDRIETGAARALAARRQILKTHAFELAVEGLALDVEDLGGAGLIAVGGGEDFADLLFFGVG